MNEIKLGEVNLNTFGTPMKIIEYKNSKNVIIEFQDEYKFKKKCEYKSFKKGTIKNPYDKENYGVGYFGVGKYKARENGKITKVYDVWTKMLQRCYDPYYMNKYPTYIDCYVCKEWHNFQVFAEWYKKEIYECNGERIELDKDILCKGNKIYSPETCVFVPQRINSLFVKSNSKRGKLPIGTSIYKNEKIRCYCNCYCENEKKFKSYHLGYFPLNKPFQAFTCYKNFKENHIKQVADEYKDLIPKKLYEALYRYEVEIND